MEARGICKECGEEFFTDSENYGMNLTIPPQNIEAERVVLCACLQFNRIGEVKDYLTPEDFYRQTHAEIFQAACEVQGPLDFITMIDFLKRKDLLEKIGGQEYLFELFDLAATGTTWRHHADILRDLRLRRDLIASSHKISEQAFSLHEPIDQILDSSEKEILNISKRIQTSQFKKMDTVIKESFRRLEQIMESEGGITGLSTGYLDFDRFTAGLQASDLIILASRPSMGKTALSLNIAQRVATKGNPVAIFSLEMADLQLGLRMLGTDARVNSDKIRTGYMNDTDWAKITESAGKLSDLPIYIEDLFSQTVVSMKSKCRQLQQKSGLSLVIIDYLQLMGGGKSESREREIAEVSRSLKGLAKDLNIPVLALSQLNRGLEQRSDKKPRLADLRESGSLEQDTDLVVFLYRDEIYHPITEENRNIAEIIIAKQRNGPIGNFKLAFLKEYMRFEDYAAFQDF